MNDNPYSTMLMLMQEHGAKRNPPAIQIGEVIAPLPDIKIKIGTLQIDIDNILIADYLLPGYQRQINIPQTTATGTMTTELGGEYNHTHTIDKIGIQGNIQIVDTLAAGDLVAVMPTQDRQMYIVLARLVNLNG